MEYSEFRIYAWVQFANFILGYLCQNCVDDSMLITLSTEDSYLK
jgi:hypothetical protein